MLTLVVSLRARPGKNEELRGAVARQCAATLEHEPGCLRFDVCVDDADPAHLILYEIYADEAALEAHRTTAHFARWREAADACVAEQVNTLATGAERPAPSRRSVVLDPDAARPRDRGGGASTVHLVSRELGAQGITNGITRFEPGAAIALHSHDCDESVLVLEGRARFEDEHGSHELGAGETTLVPAGVVHRFVNAGDGPLRIFWTYASSQPTRTLASTGETVSIRAEAG